MGVIFFILNAAFACILLVMVLIASLIAIFSKNPDVRYQPMRDDRGSFIKSQTQLTTELDALGATARGESKIPFKPRDAEEDSYSSVSFDDRHMKTNSGYNQMSLPYNGDASQQGMYQSTAYDGSPYASHGPRSERAMSMRSTVSTNRSQYNGSPWQRGAGYER